MNRKLSLAMFAVVCLLSVAVLADPPVYDTTVTNHAWPTNTGTTVGFGTYVTDSEDGIAIGGGTYPAGVDDAPGAVQLGHGENTTDYTLQFRDYKVPFVHVVTDKTNSPTLVDPVQIGEMLIEQYIAGQYGVWIALGLTTNDWRIMTTNYEAGAYGIGSIWGRDIKLNTIGGTNVAIGGLTGANLALKTVGATNIGDNAVTGAQIGLRSISNVNVIVGTLTGAELALDTVADTNMAHKTIGTNELENGVMWASDGTNKFYQTGTFTNGTLFVTFDSAYAASIVPVVFCQWEDPAVKYSALGTSNMNIYVSGQSATGFAASSIVATHMATNIRYIAIGTK